MGKNKKQVILIGDLPLASEVFKLFHEKKREAVIAGVLVEHPQRKFLNDPFDEKRNLCDIARAHGVPVFFSCEEVLGHFGHRYPDIGISCRASIIYKRNFIDCFRTYFINMHGGLLPERPGVNIACHSIIEGDSIGGATLHLISEKIDAGDIIERKTFTIDPDDTAFRVYQKTQLALIELIQKNIDNILNHSLKIIPQSSIYPIYQPKFFKKRHLEELKRVDLSSPPALISRVVRGCDFPGHEPAYIMIGGKKIYLTTRPFHLSERNG
jgi:methionyl-tRNA formyltransferase